ncbi:MAG TPA: hypothetical protein VEA69_07145 [Tepidisphaeraceae bacterium]|nr:hypothetical protein [Tepidisphaeraceae bacterium]
MDPAPLTREFVLANRIEAALWAGIALGFLVQCFRTRGRVRRTCAIAFAAFLAFGGSDWVESHTGAWWRPWWLLVWKGACLAVFAGLLFDHVRRRRRGDAAVHDEHV